MLKKAPDFHNAMLLYRNTPPQGQAYSPAQRMFLRRTRTTLPTSEQLLAPTIINFQDVKDEILKKRKESKLYYDKTVGTEQKPLNIESYAYAKPRPTQKGKPWIYGEVIAKDEPRSYTIQTPRGITVRRNRVQLRPAAPPSHQINISTNPVEEQIKATPITTIEPVQPESTQPKPIQSTPTVQNPNSDQPQISQTGTELPSTCEPATTTTRSGRVVKTPVRLKDYILE